MNGRRSTRDEDRERTDSLNKGLGFVGSGLEEGTISGLGWNLLHEDLSLPSAVLYEDRLRHNLSWMEQFIAAYGVKLAPHGKTTMAPRLFEMQLKSGAWGITLATAQQTEVAYRHGVRRVLMANQLVGKENMAIISRLLENSAFEYYCLVDSAAQIDLLGAFYSRRAQRLNVLLELGVPGGRTGVRDDEQLEATLAALESWNDTLLLSGVEIYEGVLEDETLIRAFLERAVAVTRQLAIERRFQRARPCFRVRARHGMTWWQRCSRTRTLEMRIEIVLRPGCYVTHDAGDVSRSTDENHATEPNSAQMHTGLLPALQIWAYVQSVPEQENAIIAMGKRDAAFDAGLPDTSTALQARRHCAEAGTCSLDADKNDGSACLYADCAEDDLARRRHDRFRHISSLPHIRQMARVADSGCGV